jgi:acyl-CoA thioesterase-1
MLASRFLRLGHAALLVGVFILASGPARAQVVAFGTSNVSGWNVAANQASPTQLQDMLRAAGYKATVINAGVGGDTSADMLNRVERDIPAGTKIVVLDMIGRLFNHQKHGITRQQGDANMAAIEANLRGRGITVIPVNVAGLGSWSYYQDDHFHLTPEGHRLIAQHLLLQVEVALGSAQVAQAPSTTTTTPAPSADVRAACSADAKRLCAAVITDEVKRRQCMHDHLSELSKDCLAAIAKSRSQ